MDEASCAAAQTLQVRKKFEDHAANRAADTHQAQLETHHSARQ